MTNASPRDPFSLCKPASPDGFSGSILPPVEESVMYEVLNGCRLWRDITTSSINNTSKHCKNPGDPLTPHLQREHSSYTLRGGSSCCLWTGSSSGEDHPSAGTTPTKILTMTTMRRMRAIPMTTMTTVSTRTGTRAGIWSWA